MSGATPAEVIEAAVAVCGSAFHYRPDLRAVFVGCGVDPQLYDAHAADSASKYVTARRVFAQLAERGSESDLLVRRIVTELANMTRPRPTAPDQEAGRRALAELKQVATARRVLVDVADAEREKRLRDGERRTSATLARRNALSALQRQLTDLHSSTNHQGRGYALERLVADLFALFGITYRPSYRAGREQVDGAFEYKGFQYLVEARWRASPPDFGDLADFKGKVDGKLESTRGLFLSMAGFEDSIVAHFMGVARGSRNNLILVDATDLALILDGLFDLLDALDYKIARASQEGVWWAPLATRR
jgi:hypothetical protein